MSAHILTTMNETVSDLTSQKCEAMFFALGYARFGDQLDPWEWSILRSLFLYASKSPDYAQTQAIRDFWYNYVLPRFHTEWEKLGYPDTIEQWMERKYPVNK